MYLGREWKVFVRHNWLSFLGNFTTKLAVAIRVWSQPVWLDWASFDIFWQKIFYYKSDFGDFWSYFDSTIFEKNRCSYFGGNFFKKLSYF